VADRDDLLARAADGDLAPEDRAALAGDPALAAEAAALARLRRALAADPSAPRADLADRVMRDVRRRARRSRWPSLAAAGLAAAFAATLVAGLTRHPVAAPAPSPLAGAPAGHLVRFALDAPAEARVALAGDWNGWVPQPLERAPDGTWSTRLVAAAGEWRYQLVVDGAWTADPHAPAYRPDGFGGKNAILKID
jgi:Glycogen recognition site of AMP-activated protein kinase